MAQAITLLRETTFQSKEAAAATRLYSVNLALRGHRSPVCYSGIFDTNNVATALKRKEDSARRETHDIPTVIMFTITEETFALIQPYISHQYRTEPHSDYGYDGVRTFKDMYRSDDPTGPYTAVYGIDATVPNEVWDALDTKIGFLNPTTNTFDYTPYSELRAQIEGQQKSLEGKPAPKER